MRTFREFINENKPIDGDGRTKKEIVKQIRGLDDETLILWSKDIIKGKLKFLASKTRKFGDIEVQKEMDRRKL